MEEKERYELIGYCSYRDTGTGVIGDNFVDILNQQDKRIKELEGRIKTLKTNKAHFKKISGNVVDLLKKLNKFIGEPQTRDLNYYKVIEDTKNYIKELKQSQKQLAIEELEKLEENILKIDKIEIKTLENGYSTLYCDRPEIITIIDNQIKELGGGENE